MLPSNDIFNFMEEFENLHRILRAYIRPCFQLLFTKKKKTSKAKWKRNLTIQHIDIFPKIIDSFHFKD